MKTKFFFFLVFLFIRTTTFSQSIFLDKIIPPGRWVTFYWDADTVKGKINSKIAIDLPVNIEDINKSFRAQFDLGSYCSIIYGGHFNPFLKSNPWLKKKIDLKRKGWFFNVEYPYIDINFSIGPYIFKDSGMVYLRNYGDKYSEKDIEKMDTVDIGTIGSDIFQDKILIIDYPLHRIAILDSLPKETGRMATFINAKLDFENKMMLPVVIKDSTHYLLFDTGSSADYLLTDTKRWKLITNQSGSIDTITYSSWNNKQTSFGATINVPVSIAGRNLEGKIAYDQKGEFIEHFHDWNNIYGLTGNAPFFNDVVILDYQHKKFGIVNK